MCLDHTFPATQNLLDEKSRLESAGVWPFNLEIGVATFDVAPCRKLGPFPLISDGDCYAPRLGHGGLEVKHADFLNRRLPGACVAPEQVAVCGSDPRYLRVNFTATPPDVTAPLASVVESLPNQERSRVNNLTGVSP